MLVKQGKYFWNAEEAVEPSLTTPHRVGTGPKGDALIANGTHGARSLMPPIGNVKHQALGKGSLVGNRAPYKATRNLRDVWIMKTNPWTEVHPAIFPELLAERCIRLGSKEGDLVLDPFAGSGTTGLVARQLGRNSVLMDISEEYCKLMRQRLTKAEATEEAMGNVMARPAQNNSDAPYNLSTTIPIQKSEAMGYDGQTGESRPVNDEWNSPVTTAASGEISVAESSFAAPKEGL